MTQPPSDPPAVAASPLRKAMDNPWLVLALLFFVTLFLGLPVLWYSRAFSRTSKLVWTALVLLWSAVVCAVFVWVMWWCYVQIVHALR